MKTKIAFLIEQCSQNGAPKNSCEKCSCNERECMLNLLEEFNKCCNENEEIDAYWYRN